MANNSERKIPVTIVVDDEAQQWRFVVDYENWHNIGENLAQTVFNETQHQFMNTWCDNPKHWLNRIAD